MNPTLERQPVTSQRDRLLSDYGDNRTLELAMIVRAWHGIGHLTPAGPTCKHCLPTALWPCSAFDLAHRTIVSLTRDEPYGPPETNEYLREVIAREDAAAELAAEAALVTREAHRSAWFT